MKKKNLAILGILMSISAAHADNTTVRTSGILAENLIQVLKNAGVRSNSMTPYMIGVHDLTCSEGQIEANAMASPYAQCTFKETIFGPPITNYGAEVTHTLVNEDANRLIDILKSSHIERIQRTEFSYYSILNLTCEESDSALSTIISPGCTFVVQGSSNQ